MVKKVSVRGAQSKSGAKPLVVRYLRVSRVGDRKLGEEAFRSPGIQLEEIDRCLNDSFGKDGWEPVPVGGNYSADGVLGVWADFDTSGTTRRQERPGLTAALEAVSVHGAVGLGVYNLSRWARSVSAGLEALEYLQSNLQAELFSAQESFLQDTGSAAGRFQLGLFLQMAQLFAEQSGENWQKVIQQRTITGHHHARPPVGYHRLEDPATGKPSGDIVPNEDTAHLVVKAFESYASGTSKTKVGEALREAGVISSTSQATAVLSNRNYVKRHNADCIGERCERLDSHGDHGEVSSWVHTDRKQAGVFERDYQEWYPGIHKGIISVELFDQVQTRLTRSQPLRNSSTAERKPSASHELVGCVRCAHCGRALAFDKATEKKHAVFKCSSGKQRGCKGPGAVSASKMLRFVLSEIDDLWSELSGDPGAGEDISEELAADTKAKEKQVDIEALYKKHEVALSAANEVEVKLNLDEFEGGKAAGQDLLQRYRKRIGELQDEITEAMAANPKAQAPPEALGPVATDWDALSVEERNEALRRLVTVYVERRGEDAPFRQPYEERSTLLWSWF